MSVIFRKIISVCLSVVLLFGAALTAQGVDDGFVDFNPNLGKLTEVRVNNNNGTVTTQELSVYEGLTEPTLAGAVFEGWYLDEALTKPAKGDVTSAEVWAKWRSQVADFDSEDIPTLKHTSDRYEVKKYIGKSNTSALYCKELNTNWLYPDHLVLYNPDGTVYNTVADHEYAVSLLVRMDDWSTCTWNSIGVLRHSVNKAYEESSESGVYPGAYMSADGATPARSVIMAHYQEAVNRNGSDFNSYVYLNFKFKATGATPIYLMLRGMGSTFTLDNFSITDLTARKNVTFGDTVVSGYAGEEITYPNAEGDMNVIGYKTADGEAFTEKIFIKDVILTPEYRNIAITYSDVCGGTLNLKMRFEGADFAMDSAGENVLVDADGNVTLKRIGIGNFLYPVVGAGININGEVFSGSDFKYSVAESNLLEVVVNIDTTSYNTEYKDIEGYIDYVDAFGETKRLTSKVSSSDISVRENVALSYNAVAGFGSGAEIGYTDPTGKYTLTWYDEFSSNEWDNTKWSHGDQYAVRDNSTLRYVADSDHSYKADGNLVIKSTYDAENDVFIGVRAQPRFKFYHGYIETRMKISNEYLSGTGFWLNNAGVYDDDPIKPTDDSPAVAPEIDVVEVFDSVEEEYGITFHMWGYKDGVQEHRQLGGGAVKIDEAIEGTTNQIDYTKYKDAEGYITAGFERTEDTMNFYIHEADGTRKLLYSVTYNELKAITWGGTATEKLSLFVNPVFLIFGQGVYDSEDYTVFSEAVSYVDYVRIYE